jgi:hypothetical protein
VLLVFTRSFGSRAHWSGPSGRRAQPVRQQTSSRSRACARRRAGARSSSSRWPLVTSRARCGIAKTVLNGPTFVFNLTASGDYMPNRPPVGVSGMMARRDSPAPVNTPTCRQLRHSTVTVGSARNARSDIPEKIGRLLPLSESTHSGQRQDSTRRACKAADKDAPLLHQQVRRSFVLATPHTPVSTSAAFAQPRSAILCQCQSGTGYGFGPVSISVKRT